MLIKNVKTLVNQLCLLTLGQHVGVQILSEAMGY